MRVGCVFPKAHIAFSCRLENVSTQPQELKSRASTLTAFLSTHESGLLQARDGSCVLNGDAIVQREREREPDEWEVGTQIRVTAQLSREPRHWRMEQGESMQLYVCWYV